jgi:hypothetical protein
VSHEKITGMKKKTEVSYLLWGLINAGYSAIALSEIGFMAQRNGNIGKTFVCLLLQLIPLTLIVASFAISRDRPWSCYLFFALGLIYVATLATISIYSVLSSSIFATAILSFSIIVWVLILIELYKNADIPRKSDINELPVPEEKEKDCR